jgi:hypothetical protein
VAQPAFSIDQLTNGGFPLEIGGKVYRFAELRAKDYGRLQGHIRRIQPKAVDVLSSVIKDLKLTPEDLTESILKAYERDIFWPVSCDSPPGLGMIQNDDEARTDLIKFCLEKHQPGITSTEAREIQEQMTVRQFSAVAVFAVTGRLPEEILAEQNDPERQSPSTGT